MPEDTGRNYDTSERDGVYAPIHTDPDNDVLQIHTDGEKQQGEISTTKYKSLKPKR